MLSSLMVQRVDMGKTVWITLSLVIILSACTTSGVTLEPISPSPEARAQQTNPVGIPHEYIPSPGWCRVWHTERSPDKQPQPERCLEILEVPPGARLVYGGAMVKTYRIQEYDPQRPGILTYINYFELESGRFLRQEKVCR